MNKLIALTGAMLLVLGSYAQSGKVKLSDIVQQHEAEMAGKTAAPFTNIYQNKEKGDYHFQRWYWYWKQHTDRQGYIVSKKDAYRTWSAFEAQADRANAKTTATKADWKPLGPYSQSGLWLDYQRDGIGRINTMAFHPTNPDEFIVGTAGGGAWRTKDFGTTWTAITENLMSPAVTDIDYNPLNPNTIYICTGDRNGRHYSSIGVIKSTDGGMTWDTTGVVMDVSDGVQVNSLAIHPTDTNTLTLSVNGNIVRSTDGGATWNPAAMHAPPNSFQRGRIWEIVYHPANPMVMFAPSAIVELDASGQPTGLIVLELLRSIDGGQSWNTEQYLPEVKRAAMAVNPANPASLKIVAVNLDNGLDGVYESIDTGKTYVKIFDDNNCATNLLASESNGVGCGGQGQYDLTIAINPADTNHLIIGGVNSWESNNNGMNWDLLTQGSYSVPNIPLVHADHHHIAFHPHPTRGMTILDCNDGGIVYFGEDPNIGRKWHDIASGMNITQFYRIAASGNAHYILGGAQDNGSGLMDRNTNISTSVGPGDGMDCAIDPVDANIIYYGVQNGLFGKWDLSKGISSANLKLFTADGGGPSGAWTSPLVIDPNDHKRVLTGLKAVYLSTDQGENWTPISGDFANNLSRIAMTMASTGTIYATEDAFNNNIHYTHDTGTTWTTIQHPYNENMISDIKVDQFDKDRFWVTFPGFGQNKTKVAMYDSGTWTTMDQNLPDLPVSCIIQDTSNKTLYIGTYTGVYYRTPMMPQWEKYTANLPLVNVNDLEINYKTGELIAGTWGRGMWTTPKYEVPATVQQIAADEQDVLGVYPNPSNGDFVVMVKDNSWNNKTASVSIIDVTGKAVYNTAVGFAGNKAQVQTQQLPAGNYILQVVDVSGNRLMKKIIIAKK